jgi:predicted Zn-dependent protease
MVPPVLGDLATKRARDTFNENPAKAGEALDLLDTAARLRRGSDVPRLYQAQIVVALGHPELAGPYYRDAIGRDPRDVYAHTALAAVESSRGRRADAVRNAAEAVRLSPRDTTARRVLERLRAGRRVTIYDVNKDYRERVRNRGR